MPTKVTLIYWPDPMFGMRWLCALCVFLGDGGVEPTNRPPTDGQTVNRFVALMQISGNTNIFNVFVVWTELRQRKPFFWARAVLGRQHEGRWIISALLARVPARSPGPFSAPIFRIRTRCRAVRQPFPVGGRS